MRQLKISNSITSRESWALDKYLNDIGKIELLDVEQEADLARRIRNGDKDALDIMTRANLRFVVSVAKQYQNQGLSLNDLINEGNMGLIKAARRFDETKGFKFISYAVWWIRQSILQAIVEYSRIVRLPVNKVSSYNRVNEAYLAFIQEFEREPSHEEIAEVMGISVKEVATVLRGNVKHLSMDSPMRPDDDESGTMLDTMSSHYEDSPDLELIRESLRDEVKEGLNMLSDREIDVISAYFGLNSAPLTLDEIAEMYDLSRERVRQIKERAIRRLRKSCNRMELRSYLGA